MSCSCSSEHVPCLQLKISANSSFQPGKTRAQTTATLKFDQNFTGKQELIYVSRFAVENVKFQCVLKKKTQGQTNRKQCFLYYHDSFLLIVVFPSISLTYDSLYFVLLKVTLTPFGIMYFCVNAV